MRLLQKSRDGHDSATLRFGPCRKPARKLDGRLFFRSTLGGAICGCLLGIFGGAACGALYGALRDDLSLGLDGALIGSLVTALGGAVYGGVLAVTGKVARPAPDDARRNEEPACASENRHSP